MSSTTRLQACGVAIGPVFLGVWLVQALTREGFDPARHPLSLLSLGDQGWIQVANFIAAGLLYLGFAAGVRRALHPGPGSTWAPADRVGGPVRVRGGPGGPDHEGPAAGAPCPAPAALPGQAGTAGTISSSPMSPFSRRASSSVRSISTDAWPLSMAWKRRPSPSNSSIR
ncbi:hypothetical protein PS9374_01608 [Planomonospora sphaerica]|uniref:DUF998 domain-containing protein n=1 Tax=Planomonospora sphaerica TaxID=161355 RepID=A0A171C1U5_9ACTN|nr:hypothetical protein PS9374_01608 [Planomonospora sphaerica]